MLTNNKLINFSVILALLTAIHGYAQPQPKQLNAQPIAESINTFAVDLYGKLQTEKGNLFFSPYSISTALAMTYAGARGNTAAQMEKVLHFGMPPDELHAAMGELSRSLNSPERKAHYQLSTANRLWGQKDYNWLPEFLELTDKHYGAGLQKVDFVGDTEGSRNIINKWVEKETQDKIKELLHMGDIDGLTKLVLTNAIYFKGNWQCQFEKDQTRDEAFHLRDGKTEMVPMMHRKGKCQYMETDSVQILGLPYEGEELSMFIVLPKALDGLSEVEEVLESEQLEEWINSASKREVEVALPKFKFTERLQLNETLEAMGMPDAFNSEADFSGMDGTLNLFISKVIHQAFVDVNEEGTEAAAATAVVMTLRSAPAKPLQFRADHPFLFLIRDNKSGAILFMGRVMDPRG